MIKLKHILQEADVFGPPDTFSIKAPEIKPAEKVTDLPQFAKPPYDNMYAKFEEVDVNEQEKMLDTMKDQYDRLLLNLQVNANTLYGKKGLVATVGDEAKAGEVDLTDIFAKNDNMRRLIEMQGALTAQAEEIEVVLALMKASMDDGDPGSFDEELGRLETERKASMAKYLESKNAKAIERSSEIQKALEQGQKRIEKKTDEFAKDLEDAFEEGADGLKDIEPPGEQELKRLAKDISKAQSTYDDFITKYGDDEDDEDTKKLISKLQKSIKADEGMIKLKPLLESNIDVDVDRIFMKGRTQKRTTDEPDPKAEFDIEKALARFERDAKKSDLEAKNVKEAIGMTIAGVALSMPTIIGLVGKFVNVLKRIPGLKSLSGDKLIALGDKYHHKIEGAFEFALRKAGVKDSVKAKKYASWIYHGIIALLLIGGGHAAYRAATTGNIVGSTLKTALNMIKGGEIRAFLMKGAEALS